MKKKLFAWALTLAMIMSIMPTSVFAEGTFKVGDTYSNTSADATLPSIPDGLEWSGPAHTHTCDTVQHTHSLKDGCFEYVTTCNPIIPIFHSHDSGCYTLICGKDHKNHTYSCYETSFHCDKTEHTHGADCPVLYIWTLVEGSTTNQYRDWWPVYWDFDIHSNIRNEKVVSVTASNETVKFSDGEVVSSTALKEAAEGTTATVKDVRTDGFEITVDPGYYVTHYRLVCGNHTGCGVTSYSDGIVTGNTENSYTATIDYLPPVSEFNHWYNIGGMHNNINKNNGVYQPVIAPSWDAARIYHTHGSNTLYPFYLLIEVARDTKGYAISYDWGELANTLADYPVPVGENNLLRNTEHTVKFPGEGAEYANELGFVFTGWKVVSPKYANNIIVQPDSKVTIYGADIKLVAQWEAGVSYEYVGDVPDGAGDEPVTELYTVGSPVQVKPNPITPVGYSFSGWTTTSANVTVIGGTFEMPANSVMFTGSFRPDTSVTKNLSYTVEYYFNGKKDASLQKDLVFSDTVWVGESDYLPITASEIVKTFDGYKYEGSLPDVLPTQILSGSTIKLYYAGTNVDLSVEKTVRNLSAESSGAVDTSISDPLTGVKIGDVLEYTIIVRNSSSATADAKDIVIYDTLNGTGAISFKNTSNITYSRGNYTARSIEADIFTIGEIEIGQSVTITYTYTVLAEDEGQVLVNFAFHHDGESGDSAYVQVDEYHTLTVEHYADGMLQSRLTKEYVMEPDTAWSISIGDSQAIVTYEAPESITADNVRYAFDPLVNTAALSGILESDTTVKLYYSRDEIGTEDPDESDGTPDKYQVTFIYETTEGGRIANGAITKEVVNVYASDGSGSLAEKGIATASGTTTRPADLNHRYALDEYMRPEYWTLRREGHAAFEIDRNTAELSFYQLPPDAHVADVAKQAVGGYTYIFTAPYEQILPTMSIEKLVGREHVSAGTNLEYVIHVKNTGNVDLTNIVVNDVMTYVSNHHHTNIPEYRKYISELRVTGVEGAEISDAFSSITIPKLVPGQTASIEYIYMVQPQDTGKNIHNVASVTANEIRGAHSDEETVTVGYIVTYTDGVEGMEVFKDQVTKDLKYGGYTPAFHGNQPISYTDANGHMYVFTGWNPTVATRVTDSVIYVAQWEIATAGYAVHYYKDSIVQTNLFDTDSGTGNIGDRIPYITTNAPLGYKFNSISGETKITENTAENVLNVLFVKNTFAYTVNYYKDSIAESNFLGKEEGTGLFGADIPYTDGEYLPKGYKTPGKTDGPKIITSTVEKNVLNIVYDKNSYKVTYKYEGTVPTNAPEVPEEVTRLFNDLVEIEDAPTMDGYTFSGWKIDNQAASDFNMPAHDVTITGSWAKRKDLSYIVKYLEKDTNTVLADTKTVNNTIFGETYSEDAIAITGYSPDTAEKSVTITTGTNEIIFYYSKNSYKVTYKYEGTVPTNAPEVPEEVTYLFNDRVEIEDAPTLEGYTFSGWKIGNQAASDFNMPAHDVIITGSWTKNAHAIIYKITGDYFTNDSYETIVNVEYGTELSMIDDDMSKTGYTFSGWSSLPETMPDEDVIITGSYTINKYKVTFVDEDGTTVLKETTEYPYGTKAEDIVKPENPTKGADDTYNYVFAGWTPAIVDVTEDVTYKAIYTPYTKADLKVEKVIASIGGSAPTYDFFGTLITKAKVGDEIVWDFVIENIGQTATKVTLTDVLKIAGVETRTVVDMSTIILNGGASYTLKSGYKYTVKLTDAEKTIANTVIAVAEDGKLSYGDSDEIKIEPAVIVSKTVDKRAAKTGELLTYAITIKNNSSVDLENLAVVDKMLDKTVSIDNLEKNGVWTKSYEYFVKSTDAGKKLVNSVVVKSGDQTLDEADSPETEIAQSTPGHPKPKPQLNTKDHYAYIIGLPDGLVHPELQITRAEVATIFFRMLLDDSREYFWSQTNSFSDVPETAWFNNAVSTLANAELIKGYPDGTYKPNAFITRAEFATIAIRFFLEDDVEISATNLTDVKGHWAEANINLAYALDLITGYPDGTFRPDQLITRAEAMTIVNRVLKRAPHKDHLLDDMIHWPDNMNEKAWYYAAVQEATNSHAYHMTGKKGEEYEIWTELLPVRDWAALEKEWSEANSSKNPGEVVDINIRTP